MFDDNEIKLRMEKVIDNLVAKYTTVRAGRANPNILNGIMVEAYGVLNPINSIASISIPEARQLNIKPFDKGNLKNIEKALYAADLGMNPTNNGEILILNFPALTEETRKTCVKQAKEMTEEAHIALRNIRQDANNDVKREKFPEDEEDMYMEVIQELTTKYNKKIDDLFKEKEQELMTV
ncbi:MAG: ribosome recycling factor [Bacilli bacterium]